MDISFISSEISAKILGLDICADTLVGDEMLKGISGGQKKRLTTGTSLHFLLLVDEKVLLGILKL